MTDTSLPRDMNFQINQCDDIGAGLPMTLRRRAGDSMLPRFTCTEVIALTYLLICSSRAQPYFGCDE